MSVGDIRQRICSVVAMHRFSGRQYRSDIQSMPIIIMQRHPKIEVMELSDLYPNKGTDKYYRAYAEVQKSNVKKNK